MKNLWIYLAGLCCLITALAVILMKYISLSKCNLKNIVILTFILCGFLSLIYIIFDKNFLKDIKNTITKKDIFLIILFSIIILLNRLLQIYAFKISPQIGYSHLIINMNIIFTLIASYFLFKQKINIKSLIGIIITLIGLTITICYSN